MILTPARVALLSFIAVLISDILIRINSFIGLSNGSTLLTIALQLVSVLGFVFLASRFSWREQMPSGLLLFFKLMMLWSLVSFMRGAFNVSGYWEWKVLMLNYLPTILVPLVLSLGLNFPISVKTLSFISRKVFIFGVFFIPFALTFDHELYSRIVVASCLFVLFTPYLKWRWRMLIVVVAFTSVLMDLSYRVNLIRNAVAFSLLGVFLFRDLRLRPAFNLAIAFAFITPLVFLHLGVSDSFNIFRDTLKLDYSVSVSDGGQIGESSLDADTRTFLYQEVFYSMRKRGSSFLTGEGGGSGYESDAFQSTVLTAKGRFSSEVGFLNTVLYSGAIGVLLYAAVLFIAIFYAVNRSNNTLCKMLGFFLAVHWVLFFIEDIPKLDMNYFFLWFAIGLCSSHRFRALSDVELREFFKRL